jgi:hypothetical protein
LNNLRVSATPIGYLGPAPDKRSAYSDFDQSGLAIVEVKCELLESRLQIDIIDQTMSGTVKTMTVDVSPFVRLQLWHLVVWLDEAHQGGIMTRSNALRTATTLLAFTLILMGASTAQKKLKITWPTDNETVTTPTIVLRGSGAAPTDTIVVSVFTDRSYPQKGTFTINSDGSWSFSPVYLSGEKPYDSHTIEATIIRNGVRGETASVSGIRRQGPPR